MPARTNAKMNIKHAGMDTMGLLCTTVAAPREMRAPAPPLRKSQAKSAKSIIAGRRFRKHLSTPLHA